MSKELEAVIFALTQPGADASTLTIFDPTTQFDDTADDEKTLSRSLNAAFLIAMAGSQHPAYERATAFLHKMADAPRWKEVAQFYLSGLEEVQREIDHVSRQNPDFAARLAALAAWVAQPANPNRRDELAEETWSVFFPEANGIRQNWSERVAALRAKRTVTITTPATPLNDPARQILFTSNALLGVPLASYSLADMPLSDDLKTQVQQSMTEPQLYWYDHPIPIGIPTDKNEVIYGLRGLEAAIEFEKGRGNVSADEKVSCVLSVSVTHKGLQTIARQYLEEEIKRAGGLKILDVYAFSEVDTQRIVDEILVPSAQRYLQQADAAELLSVVGVDGEYGRHYSFLKAIAPFWSLFIEPEVKATFKIDLDQVFPQKELVEQAGASMLEHFKSPLWGAQGTDSDGRSVELGMIAGALVNERDISKGLFYPDVQLPNRALTPDEYIFFSQIPQALSTEAEMMTRYNGTDGLDGQHACIQRIHVTGGTNGILVDSLYRYRPFTPSFMGRAEDQAYLISVFAKANLRLAYLHKDGLIMRHDKEAFAMEAIQAATVGKMIGDYQRTLYFSEYAEVATPDFADLKDTFNPFTGAFISLIPRTVVYLRFGMKAAGFFAGGKATEGHEFVTMGAPRIMQSLNFTDDEKGLLRQQFEREVAGWNLYYDTLLAIKTALDDGDEFAQNIAQKARDLVKACLVG